jgi:hypothetical protein
LSRECLTDDEIDSLRDVPPGAAPGELAHHLAGCERCQSRALFGAVRKTGLAREQPQLPSLGRALALLAMVILAIAFFFWTLRKMAG